MDLYSKVFKELPEEAKKIREEIFVVEQGFTEEFDSVDLSALHIVVYDGYLPIGTCRIFSGNENNAYFVGRIAVVREYRSKGIGRYILDETEKLVCGIGGRKIELHSQYKVKAFYEKCGYTAFGDIDYEEGCPHIWMRKLIYE